MPDAGSGPAGGAGRILEAAVGAQDEDGHALVVRMGWAGPVSWWLAPASPIGQRPTGG